MCYLPDQIYVIQLNARLNSRMMVRIVGQNDQLCVLPFNIPDQEPLPIAILKHYQPQLMGETPEDHQCIATFIAKHYATTNLVLWHALQRRLGKRTLGKLFMLCEN